MSTDLTFRTHVVSQRDCRSKHLAQSSSPCGNVARSSSSRHEYTFGEETKIAPDFSVPAAWASSLPEESRNESSTDLMSFGCSRSETSITITMSPQPKVTKPSCIFDCLYGLLGL